MPLPWRVFLGLDSILLRVDLGLAIMQKQRRQLRNKNRNVKRLSLL